MRCSTYIEPSLRATRTATWTLGMIAMMAVAPLGAATCGLNTQGVDFGSYDFQNSQNLDSVGHVTVTCDVSTPYTIVLSPGLAGTFASRIMQSGAHQLAYNLYTDLAHASVWGDGTGNSVTVGGAGTNTDYAVYGSVPAGQNPYIGTYSDVVTVTLNF
ncbi:Spore coat protein U (SCPU) domain-containing protein [Frateuria terrea]|uniref:Spore coat protein U (SCPU) domain-containing protein n=2 Tax=Frateuria terrea TaxID=529704 RepID=A0A1H6U7N0_9GAMM|nr:Spore coat protein U (SCPU) domain-containing protein [Frateuria terrea]SFP37765.1 Spore coat protein U (SCPU) domain-containing protein [Frateuria terrea]